MTTQQAETEENQTAQPPLTQDASAERPTDETHRDEKQTPPDEENGAAQETDQRQKPGTKNRTKGSEEG